MGLRWELWYDGLTVFGSEREEYCAAPAEGLQVVVLRVRPPVTQRPWAGVSDRIIWTGDDVYDPFGWGPKVGTLIPSERYDAIWREAAYGHRCA